MEINIDKFIQIENIVLWSMFALIILTVLLSFLRGYKRGWKYGTFRFCYYIILILVAVCTLGVCSEAIGNMYLGNMLKDTYKFTIGQSDIVLKPTTLFETIKSFIYQIIEGSQKGVSSVEIQNISIALTTSTLKLIMVFVDGILLATVFNLLGLILWHAAFKFIIPTAKRKQSYKQGKVISGFEDLVAACLVLAMIISPLTSIANSFTSGVKMAESTSKLDKQEDKHVATQKEYELIKAAADTYDKSFFANVFLNWSMDNSSKTYDTRLMEFFSEYSYEGFTVSFLDELQHGSEISTYLVKSGLLNKEATSFDKTYLLLSSCYGPALLESSAKSKLVTQVLPFAYNVAINMDATQNYIGDNLGIDPYSYNWKDSIENLSKILISLQKSDLYDLYIDVDGGPHLDGEKINYLYTEKAAKEFNNVFDTFEHNEEKRNLFEDLMRAYMVNVALNVNEEEGKTDYSKLLPSTKGIKYKINKDTGRKIATSLNKEYEEINISKELKIIYNTLYRTSNIDDRITALLIDSIYNQNKFNYGVAIDIIMNNYDEMVNIIAGEAVNKKTKNTKSSGSYMESCLLDSDLVMYAFPQTVNVLCNKASDKLKVKLDQQKIIDSIFGNPEDKLSNSDIKNNLKNETRSLLSIAQKFNANQACRDFILDTNRMPGITFDAEGNLYSISDNLIDGFIGAFYQLGKEQSGSKLIRSFIPELGKIINKKLENSSSSIVLGVNTNVENFGGEIANFLKTYKDSKELINYLKQSGNAFSEGGNTMVQMVKGMKPYLNGSEEQPSQLEQLLNSIVSSEVLNKDNKNFNSLLNKVFRKLLNDDSIYFESTNPKADCAAISNILKTAIFDYGDEISSIIVSGSNLRLDLLEKIDFKKLFSPIDESKLLSDFMKLYIKKISSDKFELDLKGANSKNITSWANEGYSLNTLFKFGAEIGDLKNIDFINTDPEIIEGIIKCFALNQVFIDKDNIDKSYFGQFIYDKFVSSLDEKSLEYFINKEVDVKDTNLTIFEKTSDLKEDFEKISVKEWATEAKIFSSIISDLSVITEGNKDGSALKPYVRFAAYDICESLKTSKALGRVVSYHLFNNSTDQLKDIVKSLKDANELNSEPLWNAYSNNNQELIDKEIDCLITVVDTILDPIYGADVWLKKDGNMTGVSGQYFVKPILESMAQSVTFNTLPHENGLYTTEDLTFFEWCTVGFLNDANVLGVNDENTLNKIKDYVKKVDSNPFNNETNNPDRVSSSSPWMSNIDTVVTFIDKARSGELGFII